MKHEIEYRESYTDIITGFTGTVTAKCDYYGEKPTRYLLEGIDTTGRPVEMWVDDYRLTKTLRKD